MSRLPIVGGDGGSWGTILNDFLSQSHNSDGTLKNNTVGTSQLQSGTALVPANNLSDLTNTTTARTNLGLGNSATRNVGTTTGTVAAGDDSRIVNAITQSTADARYMITVAAPTGTATTDTATIQNAIDTATAAGGGTVLLRAGTYIVNTINLKTGVWLQGQGWQATIVQLAAGVNAHLIQTLNFLTLTGTSNTSTPFSFGVSAMTLDGNKSNQTSGSSHGLAIYGYGFGVRNLMVRNCRNYGIWTEWANSSNTPGNDSMEAFFDTWKVHDCGDGGLMVRGPHDAIFTNGIVYDCGSGASGSASFYVDDYAVGSIFTNIHVWGGNTDYGWRFGGEGYYQARNIIGDGAGNLAYCYINADFISILESWMFGIATGSAVGVKVGSATHTVNNLRLDCKIEQPGGAPLDLTFIGDSGNDIRVFAYENTPHNPAIVAGVPGSVNIDFLHSTGSGPLVTSQFTRSGAMSFISNDAAQVPVAVSGYFAGQTGDLLDFLDGSGNYLAGFGSNGYMGIGIAFNSSIGILIQTQTDSDGGMVIVAHSATQSNPLMEIQDHNFANLFRIDQKGRILCSPSGTPTRAAGANAGTSPPVPVLTGNDQRGTITFGTGTSPSAGAQAKVTFTSTYGVVPVVTLTPQNSATAALQLFVSAVSATTFTISTVTAPAASQANTVYSVAFHVIG